MKAQERRIDQMQKVMKGESKYNFKREIKVMNN
jgi:hypothetical protein